MSWELTVIKDNGFDEAEGLDLEIVELANTSAVTVALLAGEVDVIVTDWPWVTRQRAEGARFAFVPYSTSVGALMLPPDSTVASLERFPAAGDAPPVTALQNLRFSVSRGEFACLLGPSGCGKTTLLNIIAGLDRDYEGSIDLPAATRPRPVVGYVFQTPRLLPWRTVKENIALVLDPARARSGLVEELLKATGLMEFRHAYPERLSVGMTHRVSLARAFAVAPDLLLMDEPFVSLDEPTADRLRGLLLEIWRARPTTVLFVTHDTLEAVGLADRVIILTPPPASVDSIIAIDAPRDDRGQTDALARVRMRISQARSGI